jgi:hypothetical protein
VESANIDLSPRAKIQSASAKEFKVKECQIQVNLKSLLWEPCFCCGTPNRVLSPEFKEKEQLRSDLGLLGIDSA